jgi:hypothetical protein
VDTEGGSFVVEELARLGPFGRTPLGRAIDAVNEAAASARGSQ